jgi:uncharacterized protein YggT (Ycf19 family)
MFKLLFRLLYALTTFVETLVIFRIILKVINANTQNNIVSWIMNTTDILVSPFKDIVSEKMLIDKFELELTSIVALLFYAIVAFLFSELAKSFSHSE